MADNVLRESENKLLEQTVESLDTKYDTLYNQTDNSILRTVKGSGVINGVRTDIACTKFENLIFIIITQFEKFGTLIHVKKEFALEQPIALPTYTTKTVLGEDDQTTDIVARRLASFVDSNKPVLFSLALKEKSPEVVREIADLMLKNKCW